MNFVFFYIYYVIEVVCGKDIAKRM